MNENLVSNAQTDEARLTSNRLMRRAGMGCRLDGDGSGGRDVEKLRRLRLNGFLRELVRQEGRMDAAELLGINYEPWCGPRSRARSRAHERRSGAAAGDG